jgi:8-amino-7-oxononanoate synthase
VRTEAWRRERLQANVAHFRTLAAAAGVPLLESATAIQPVRLGSAGAALAAQRALAAEGLCVVAIRPPTVPAGSARLRITLGAAHSPGQIETLVAQLAKVCARQRETRA